MSSQPQGVDLSTLSVQQLSALQARLSQELEHLSTSYQRLRAAQSRFRDCIRSIQDGVKGKSGGENNEPLLQSSITDLRRNTTANTPYDIALRPSHAGEPFRFKFFIVILVRVHCTG